MIQMILIQPKIKLYFNIDDNFFNKIKHSFPVACDGSINYFMKFMQNYSDFKIIKRVVCIYELNGIDLYIINHPMGYLWNDTTDKDKI